MNRVEYLTHVYIESYKVALNEIGNPNLASQIASAVLFCIGQEQRTITENNPLGAVLAQMFAKKGDDKEDKDK